MFKKCLAFAAILAVTLPFMSSCSAEDYEVLRVYNCEDYILEEDYVYCYLNDENQPEKVTLRSVIERFQEYRELQTGKKVKVIYDCFDTNESMLSQVRTGKVDYDLICPSDYAIQKMIAEDLLEPFDKGSTPIYDQYASKFLIDKLETIKIKKTNQDGTVQVLEDVSMNDYTRGYMWGTLGVLYRADADVMDEDEFEIDYSSLWDPKFKNKVSIKDSLRDTYAIGIFEAYKDEFNALKEQYNNGSLTSEEYNKRMTEYFNKCDEDTLNEVLGVLKTLKDNIFGFEVDSGKRDIQDGKVLINTAWSGDAAYAMDQASGGDDICEGENCIEDMLEQLENQNPSTPEEDDENDIVLKYAIPEIGGNIWFDGWVMPKGANKELASAFVDFISTPEYSRDNMEYIGYTPFIASQDIFDTIYDWYSVGDECENPYYKDLSYFFKHSEEDTNEYIIPIDPEDRGTQLDTQYPDEEKLVSLCIMDDFGPNTNSVIRMWEKLKNTSMPAYFYYLVLAGVILTITGVVTYVVLKNKKRADRIKRLKERTAK